MKYLLILAFPLLVFSLYSFEEQYTIASQSLKEKAETFTNIIFYEAPDRRVKLALDDTVALASTVDLYLPFDDVKSYYGPSYFLESADFDITQSNKKRGHGAAVFIRDSSGMIFTPAENSVFGANRYVHDFTIEFWLYPAMLSDNEIVFTFKAFIQRDGIYELQEIRCFVENRRLVWSFQNFFQGTEKRFQLKGFDAILPGRWGHHLLRYNSSTGLLEYLYDAVPADVVYATSSGARGGSIYQPFIGDNVHEGIRIGTALTGLMDDFFIHNTRVSDVNMQKYQQSTGAVTFRPIDLKYTDSRIKQITSRFQTPSDTDIFYYYRISNHLEDLLRARGPQWVPFLPGVDFEQPIRGRYLQLKAELYSDGLQEYSPVLESLTVHYEPLLPPLSPRHLVATAGNASVKLQWSHTSDASVEGYLVYYGKRPGHYFGEDAALGASPIDVGNVHSVQIEGLTNGSLYYFSVVAYDAAEIPNFSLFSSEVTARPSSIHRGQNEN